MTVPTLDIRRHARRIDRSDQDSSLAPDGLAMCERLRITAPAYAAVIATPLRRAQQTAEAIGGRVPTVEPDLLPDFIGDTFAEYESLTSLSDWAALVLRSKTAETLARHQLHLWSQIAGRVRQEETALVVTHGGLIELPMVLLSTELRFRLEGGAFGYCEGVRLEYAGGSPKAVSRLSNVS